MPSEDIRAAKERLERIARLVEHRPASEAVVKVKDLRALLTHVDELNERLENNRVWVNGERQDVEPGSIPDGIECRDDTIALQDENNSRLRKRATEAEARVSALEGVLRGYRAASHWIGADSWDGCSDCMDILRAAAAADPDREMSSDEIAVELKAIRSGAIALRDARYLAALSGPAPVKEAD